MLDINVRDQKITVRIDQEGTFSCQFDNQDYRAKTLDELKGKLMKATKRKISVPFARWFKEEVTYFPKAVKPAGVRRGVIVGRHGANNNIMVRWEGEKGTVQEPSWRQGRAYLKLSVEDEKAYTAAQIKLKEIQEQIEKFEELHSIDTDKLWRDQDGEE